MVKDGTEPSRINLVSGAFGALQDLAQRDNCEVFFMSQLRLQEVKEHLQEQWPDRKQCLAKQFYEQTDYLTSEKVATAMQDIQELVPQPMNILADAGLSVLFAGRTNPYRPEQTSINAVLQKFNLGDYYPVYVIRTPFGTNHYREAQLIKDKHGMILSVTPDAHPEGEEKLSQTQWLSLLSAIVKK